MIKRSEHEKEFTIIANTALRDTRLSAKARGILATILSLPDDWIFSEAGLLTLFPQIEEKGKCKKGNGKKAIKEGLKELEKYGYLYKRKVMPSKETHGRITYEYTFFEQSQNPETEEIQDTHNGTLVQDTHNGTLVQDTHYQALENGTLQSTNIQSTKDLQSTDISLSCSPELENDNADDDFMREIKRIEDYILERKANRAEREEIGRLIEEYGQAVIDEAITTTTSNAGRSIAYLKRCAETIAEKKQNRTRIPIEPSESTAQYGAVTDNGRYEPTYDIDEIERVLDAEWYDDTGE